jgi:hypothetical protein
MNYKKKGKILFIALKPIGISISKLRRLMLNINSSNAKNPFSKNIISLHDLFLEAEKEWKEARKCLMTFLGVQTSDQLFVFGEGKPGFH